MNTVPISAACMPCFGLLCPVRSQCENYREVERVDQPPIATCENTDHERPLYLPLRWIEQEAAVA
jgi:hypothetical protein